MVYLCVAIRGDSSEGLLILRPGASAGGVGEAKWSDGGFSLWFSAVEDLPATVWKGGGEFLADRREYQSIDQPTIVMFPQGVLLIPSCID